MSREYKKFYWVNGQMFENSETRMNGKGKALRYCKEYGIDKNDIYEISNESELKYFLLLKEREEKGEIFDIKSHEKVCLVGFFTNDNGESFPAYEFETSFTYKEVGTNKAHVVYIANSVYDLTREIILSKTLYDYSRKGSGYYLEVYYLNDKGAWKAYKVGDRETFKEEAKKKREKFKKAKKALRDRERFDRLMRLREQGKISDGQLKELYKLEKFYGGK